MQYNLPESIVGTKRQTEMKARVGFVLLSR
jgi:hypothetical protein